MGQLISYFYPSTSQPRDEGKWENLNINQVIALFADNNYASIFCKKKKDSTEYGFIYFLKNFTIITYDRKEGIKKHIIYDRLEMLELLLSHPFARRGGETEEDGNIGTIALFTNCVDKKVVDNAIGGSAKYKDSREFVLSIVDRNRINQWGNKVHKKV